MTKWIEDFRRSSVFDLLLFMDSKPKKTVKKFRSIMKSLGWSVTRAQNAVRASKDFGLIEMKRINKVPPEDHYNLTEKGRKVVKLLKELSSLIEAK